MNVNLELPHCVVRRTRGRLHRLTDGLLLLLFFSKRDEKNNLICRAAVKLGGRSPESKPPGAAWLDGLRKGKSVQCVPPFGKK
ncbi:MAG: hypothetical protein IJ599_04465 [Alphaproteobacteria bacterium]|nr:hypothetical protein [Alphaproteobacteria bacterium]